MDKNDLADYFDRTKAQQQRALAALGHRVPGLSRRTDDADDEKSDSRLTPELAQDAWPDIVEARGEASSEGAS